MRSYCALYVDAGYLLASVATRLTGTSLRSGVNVDHRRLIEALTVHAEQASGLPLLRVYWYDSARYAVPDESQERVGLLPRVKLRLGRIGFNGEQKGVDLRIGLDMVSHARNGAVEMIYLVSGDDDLTEAVEEAQAHGVRVTILAVPNESGTPHGVSRHLQSAADDLDVLAPGSVDAVAMKVVTAAPEPTEPVATDDRPATVPAPSAPSPTYLAQLKREPVRTTGAPPAVAAPRPNVVYSAATGASPTIAPAYAHVPDDADEIIDRVAGRVMKAWFDSATEEQRTELFDGRPSIPRDVDRALLLDLSDALGMYDLPDTLRFRLRAGFWSKVDETST